MAGFGVRRRACRSGADCQARQPGQQGFAIDRLETDVEVPWQALGRMAVKQQPVDFALQAGLQTVSKQGEPCSLVVHFLLSDQARRTQSDDQRNRKRAATEAGVVSAAVE